MTLRQEKINNLIKHLVATFLESETNKTSLITVTNCEVSRDLKNATVFITVFPEDKESAVLDFVKRKRSDAKDFLKKHMTTRTVPFLDFEIDLGEKNRQRIDWLLNQH
ncbi:MAG: ribosome-binding factor A [Candidatus Paceibacterota bacterium]|jgi:ribosome-binding factor A